MLLNNYKITQGVATNCSNSKKTKTTPVGMVSANKSFCACKRPGTGIPGYAWLQDF